MYILLVTLATPAIFLFITWKVWRHDFSHRARTQYQDPPRPHHGNCSPCSPTPTPINKHSSFLSTDMDRHYIGFFDFCLYMTLIIPSQQFVFWKEFLSLNFRRFIHSRVRSLFGTRFLKPWYPELVAGEMLLETSEMIYLVSIVTQHDGTVVGRYEWNDFMYLCNKGELKCAEKVHMEVDLESTHLLAASIDERDISGSEAVQLLAMHVATVVHPVLHTYSNWGIDTKNADPFVRRMAKVTIIYNYLGSTWFPRSTLPFLSRWGRIFDRDHNSRVPNNMRHILHSEWMKGLPSTDACAQLAPYSKLARFVTSLCESFCRIFEKYKEDFPGIDRKAMFTGTVLHSLDHTMFTKVLEDPLWLFLDDTEFSASGKIAAFANACLSRDLPGLVFDKRFKDADHPFYKEVYVEARKLNPELADLIDTCIIK